MKKEELASLIDSTLLKPATEKEISALCLEAEKYRFAAVCVMPHFVPLACRLLRSGDVKVCTVAGFPLGENTTPSKIFEVKNAIKSGADEVDFVINLSDAKQCRFDKIKKEIESIVKAAYGKTIKVIVEECLLTQSQIKQACQAVLSGGAQFIKTSTGFSTHGATVKSVEIMAKALKDSGVKIKAAGGIKTFEQAVELVSAGACRIGTSKAKEIVT